MVAISSTVCLRYNDMFIWVGSGSPTVAWMCDESFAINMGTKLPNDVDEKWFYFHVSWLNYVFWVFSTFYRRAIW